MLLPNILHVDECIFLLLHVSNVVLKLLSFSFAVPAGPEASN